MHPYDVTDVMVNELTQEQSLAVTSNVQPKISVSTEPLSSHSVVNTPFSARFFADRVANTLRMPPMPVTSADSPSPSCVVPPKIIFKGVCKLYHSLHASSMNALKNQFQNQTASGPKIRSRRVRRQKLGVILNPRDALHPLLKTIQRR